MKKMLIVLMLALSNSAFGLDLVPISEIKAKLCPEPLWNAQSETILNFCWNNAFAIRPVTGHMVVFGFLSHNGGICYLPCDFGYFYRNGGY